MKDRGLLVDVILPAIRTTAAGSDVLFIGVEWYTAAYTNLFPDDNLVTIDIRADVAHHGAGRHVIGDVRDLTRHFDRDQFAAVIANGVIGFGLDGRADVELALREISRCTRPNGLVVIGWNDTQELGVGGLEEAAARAGLLPTVAAGLPSWRHGPIGVLRHTYEVYRKD